ncbi:MAG: hypothetical protein U0T83_01555 [Bacteriovoracaceae bacterium]
MTKKLLVLLFLISCGGGGGGETTSTSSGTPTTTRNVLVSWTANHEAKVNSINGGYKVCSGTSSTFTVNLSSCTDVPYVSGSSAPTSKTIQLTTGTWYIKVVAYSSLNASSSASTATQVVVP